MLKPFSLQLFRRRIAQPQKSAPGLTGAQWEFVNTAKSFVVDKNLLVVETALAWALQKDESNKSKTPLEVALSQFPASDSDHSRMVKTRELLNALSPLFFQIEKQVKETSGEVKAGLISKGSELRAIISTVMKSTNSWSRLHLIGTDESDYNPTLSRAAADYAVEILYSRDKPKLVSLSQYYVKGIPYLYNILNSQPFKLRDGDDTLLMTFIADSLTDDITPIAMTLFGKSGQDVIATKLGETIGSHLADNGDGAFGNGFTLLREPSAEVTAIETITTALTRSRVAYPHFFTKFGEGIKSAFETAITAQSEVEIYQTCARLQFFKDHITHACPTSPLRSTLPTIVMACLELGAKRIDATMDRTQFAAESPYATLLLTDWITLNIAQIGQADRSEKKQRIAQFIAKIEPANFRTVLAHFVNLIGSKLTETTLRMRDALLDKAPHIVMGLATAERQTALGLTRDSAPWLSTMPCDTVCETLSLIGSRTDFSKLTRLSPEIETKYKPITKLARDLTIIPGATVPLEAQLSEFTTRTEAAAILKSAVTNIVNDRAFTPRKFSKEFADEIGFILGVVYMAEPIIGRSQALSRGYLAKPIAPLSNPPFKASETNKYIQGLRDGFKQPETNGKSLTIPDKFDPITPEGPRFWQTHKSTIRNELRRLVLATLYFQNRTAQIGAPTWVTRSENTLLEALDGILSGKSEPIKALDDLYTSLGREKKSFRTVEDKAEQAKVNQYKRHVDWVMLGVDQIRKTLQRDAFKRLGYTPLTGHQAYIDKFKLIEQSSLTPDHVKVILKGARLQIEATRDTPFSISLDDIKDSTVSRLDAIEAVYYARQVREFKPEEHINMAADHVSVSDGSLPNRVPRSAVQSTTSHERELTASVDDDIEIHLEQVSVSSEESHQPDPRLNPLRSLSSANGRASVSDEENSDEPDDDPRQRLLPVSSTRTPILRQASLDRAPLNRSRVTAAVGGELSRDPSRVASDQPTAVDRFDIQAATSAITQRTMGFFLNISPPDTDSTLIQRTLEHRQDLAVTQSSFHRQLREEVENTLRTIIKKTVPLPDQAATISHVLTNLDTSFDELSTTLLSLTGVTAQKAHHISPKIQSEVKAEIDKIKTFISATGSSLDAIIPILRNERKVRYDYSIASGLGIDSEVNWDKTSIDGIPALRQKIKDQSLTPEEIPILLERGIISQTLVPATLVVGLALREMGILNMNMTKGRHWEFNPGYSLQRIDPDKFTDPATRLLRVLGIPTENPDRSSTFLPLQTLKKTLIYAVQSAQFGLRYDRDATAAVQLIFGTPTTTLAPMTKDFPATPAISRLLSARPALRQIEGVPEAITDKIVAALRATGSKEENDGIPPRLAMQTLELDLKTLVQHHDKEAFSRSQLASITSDLAGTLGPELTSAVRRSHRVQITTEVITAIDNCLISLETLQAEYPASATSLGAETANPTREIKALSIHLLNLRRLAVPNSPKLTNLVLRFRDHLKEENTIKTIVTATIGLEWLAPLLTAGGSFITDGAHTLNTETITGMLSRFKSVKPQLRDLHDLNLLLGGITIPIFQDKITQIVRKRVNEANGQMRLMETRTSMKDLSSLEWLKLGHSLEVMLAVGEKANIPDHDRRNITAALTRWKETSARMLSDIEETQISGAQIEKLKRDHPTLF